MTRVRPNSSRPDPRVAGARDDLRPIAGSPVACAHPAAEQLDGFRHAREARRSALVEDYLELIADLTEAGGEARQVDVAARLGVAQPTVAKMLKRLTEEGFVAHRPHRGAVLTPAGHAIALRSRERHRVVEAFLLALGVTAATARRDAEGLEHHVSAETLEAFARFLRRT